MLGDSLQRQKVRPFIIGTILVSLIWIGVSWLIVQLYTSWKIDLAYVQTQQHTSATMDEFYEGTHRTISLLQTIPSFIGQNSNIQKSIHDINLDTTLAEMSREKREAYLQKFDAINQINYELAEATQQISVISAFWLMRNDGITVASSNALMPESFVGSNFKDREYFQDAIAGKIGRHYIMGRRTRTPGFVLSAPVYANGQIIGVLAEKLDLSYLYNWVSAVNGMIIDQHGIIIESADPAYELMAMPNSDIYSLSEAERQLRYQRTTFEVFHLNPVADPSKPSLYTIGNDDDTIYYVLSTQLKGHDVKLMIATKCPPIMQSAEKNWTLFLLLVIGGIFAICLGAVLTYYLVLKQRLKNQHDKQRLIQQISSYDSLTGLYSRSQIDQFINQNIEIAAKNKSLFAVMFIDLDMFKDINDSFGHEVGDYILREIAKRIQETIKDTDVAIRRGGDEFIILLNHLKNHEDIVQTVIDLQKQIKKPFIIHNIPLGLTISIGIAVYPVNGNSPSLLLRHADTALYYVKGKGRDDYAFYNQQMSVDLATRKALEIDMVSGIEKNEFFLLYQPQYSHTAGKITGCEALIRWRHPTRGIIPPSEFIPVAENSGFIAQLGEWVINKACEQVNEWRKQLNVDVPIAVNLSAVQFQRSNLVDIIRKAIRKHNIPRNTLEMEVTESILMIDTDKAVHIMQELKALGVKISIDDFGTGYSSMAYLKKFDADTLKIDRTFVSDMESNANNRAIISAIINMAESLNYHVIAEGVETKTQYDMLVELGCFAIQGYYFSRPIPPEAFSALYTEKHS